MRYVTALLVVILTALALRMIAGLYGFEVQRASVTLPQPSRPAEETNGCAEAALHSTAAFSGRVVAATVAVAGLRQATANLVHGAACRLGYFGAVAVLPAPDGDQLFVADDYNGPEAAANAVLHECRVAARDPAACALAAQVRPKGPQAPGLQLGGSATWVYQRYYLPAAAPKAFAYSPSTRAVGEAEGHNAVHDALEQCRKGGGRSRIARPGPVVCRIARGIGRSCSTGWRGAVDCRILQSE